MSRVWYFAYGSNMEPATFRGRRGIEYSRAVGARLRGWRLVLDKPPLIPIGEAFANIVPEAGADVCGVAYEITAEELEHVEMTEGVLLDNYRRTEIELSPLAPPPAALRAFTLTADRRDPSLLPSDRYMACLIAGALEHGLPAEWIEVLRAVPTTPESAEAARVRPLLDEVMRRPRSR
jgi:hypothetical protein